ncbi:MAG: Stp1/IreP family PP2C-type Ser/Thr phosphatase [Acidobacteria bacterium]|nr:Stp1/IreP family PP2C-type Ser/Thr phosphatase [Acidobacteriota bacterium]MBV9477279.1 Stp1/IreP family PP2C-type Ser/Thr phosphatase [Acidobacteriota bacterium]
MRSENQDFGTYTTPEEEKESHPGGRLLIVADGMGGHRGGATASRLAAETVKAQFLGSETRDIATALRQSLARANSRIYTEAQSNPELRGMGTTTSALAVRNGKGWLAHVGDSRIYRVRDGAIEQLTEDHSLVASMVREGLLTPAEAETHPRRNVLQRSMGVAEDVDIDVRGPIELREGDTFILCSDGLHGLVKEPELREIAALPIENAAEEFLKRALDRGAPDNVTVIVARVEASDDPGDETLLDHDDPIDETQKLSLADHQLYDETQREITQKLATADTTKVAALADTQKMVAVSVPPPAPKPIAPTLELPVEDAVDAAPAPATAAPQGGTSPVLKWALVAVLALGAAGAWFYWNHQQSLPAAAQPAAR